MAFNTSEENPSSNSSDVLNKSASSKDAQKDSDEELLIAGARDTNFLKLDRYEIESELGRGGMGIVYRARDPFLQETVALKVLVSTRFNESHLVRFQKEAKAISALSHPGFVKVFNFGIDKSSPFMVLEFINGVSLSSHIKQHGVIEPTKALRIGSQIAKAMAHAHKQNVLHRDLKPSNIMLVDRDNQLLVKIIDFGIAVLMNQELIGRYVTPSDAMIGTPAYMSPEQIENRGFDHRSDIYSLGCILFEMLAGSPPFVGDSVLEVMHLHSTKTIPQLSSGVRQVDELLNSLINRVLEKDPELRTQLMKEFADSIDSTIEALELLKQPLIPDQVVEVPAVPTLSKKDIARVLMVGSLICAFTTLSLAVIYRYIPKPDSIPLKESLADLKDLAIGVHDRLEGHNDEWLFERIQAKRKLQAIRISGGVVTDKGISYLKNTPIRYLQAADLEHVSDQGIMEICSLKHLRSLDLSGNKQVTVDAFKHLKELKHLHNLWLNACDLSLDELREISYCTGLGRLSLGANSVVGEDHLNLVKGMVNLQILNIANTNIEGKDLAKLTKLPHLWYLNPAANAKITEADLIDLIENAPVLHTLNIDGNAATDKVVAAAARSKTLKYLVGFNCPNVSQGARKGFSALPSRKFIDSPTADASKEDLDAIVNKPKLIMEWLPGENSNPHSLGREAINRQMRKWKRTRERSLDFIEP